MSKTTETTETTQAAQEQKLTFKGKEYLLSELSIDSKRFIEHLVDLDPKITKAVFQLEQLQVAKEYITILLEKSLEVEDEDEI